MITQPENIPLAKYKQLYKALCSLPKCVLHAPGRFLYSELFTLDKERNFYILGHNPAGDPDKHPEYYSDSLITDIRKWGRSPKPYNAYLDEIWPPWCNIPPGSSRYQRNVQSLCKVIDICPRKVCASNLFFVRSGNINLHNKWLNELTLTCLNNLTKEHSRNKSMELRDTYKNVHWRVHKEILELVKPKFIIAINNTAYTIIKRILGFVENKNETISIDVKNRGRKSNCYVAEGKYTYKDGRDLPELSLLVGLPDFSLDYPGELKAPVWDWVKEHCSSFIENVSNNRANTRTEKGGD